MSDRNTRRDFFAASLLTASSAALVAGAPVGPPNILNENASNQNVEWRNKQPGMAYRRFGRSGLMISEVVSDCERAYGKFLAGSAKRDKVFLQTKVSAYGTLRNRLYADLFKSLPADKQSCASRTSGKTIWLRNRAIT